MKLYCAIVDDVGNVHLTRVISDTDSGSFLAHLLSFQLSGEPTIVQEVKDVYNFHNLYGLTPEQVLDRLVALHKDDDDHVEELDLTSISDDVAEYGDGIKKLLAGPVGTDFIGMTETQTTIIVKLAD